ncbi:MAG TPA: hypothetical protein VL295_10625, partial [Gemmatimonadales bacterium]|nr:hypothetical protein [Gemmatimonadales bacterium]
MIRVVFLSVATAGALVASAGAQRAPARPRLDSLRARADRDPFDAEAQFALGMGYWDRGRVRQADSAFRRALARAPMSPAARLALANLPGVPAAEARTLTREAYLLDPFVDLRILHQVGLDELLPRRRMGEVPDGSSLAPGPLWWEGRAKSAVRALVAGRADEGYATMRGVLDAPEMRRGAV